MHRAVNFSRLPAGLAGSTEHICCFRCIPPEFTKTSPAHVQFTKPSNTFCTGCNYSFMRCAVVVQSACWSVACGSCALEAPRQSLLGGLLVRQAPSCLYRSGGASSAGTASAAVLSCLDQAGSAGTEVRWTLSMFCSIGVALQPCRHQRLCLRCPQQKHRKAQLRGCNIQCATCKQAVQTIHHYSLVGEAA